MARMTMTRLFSADLYGELFDRTPLGRRGYDPEQVDGFVQRVRTELQRRDAERDALLASHTAVKQENASLYTKLGLLDANVAAQQINSQAVNILSSAQRQAEQCYAEAEDQAQQMTREARIQCENLLAQAQRQARTILDDAHRTATVAANRAATAYRATTTAEGYQAQKEELERQLAYLQTFSTVWRHQLRSLFETLSQQIEQWPPDQATTTTTSFPSVPAPPPALGARAR